MCREMRSRRVGFHWREVETGVQNLMDFYCGDVRGEGLLRRGLERLEDAKAAPLKAENPHELARCLDVKSIIDNAELVLRSSLERTESRPTPFGFRRSDYPDQNDTEWLAFLAVRKGSDGEFRFTKLPVDR
jgi:succinate dehydrogenase/fumarate reductase flavoprotein subunit